MIGGGSGGAGHVIHHPPRSFLSSTSARGVGLPPSGSGRTLASNHDRTAGNSNSSASSLATPFALQQSASKVSQLHSKAYLFLQDVLHRYRSLKHRLLQVEAQVDLHRESLNRDAGVAEELKRELEGSLEVVGFITNCACKDAQQLSASNAGAPSTPLSSPSSASSPRSTNSSSSDRDRDRDRNQTASANAGGGLLRFPRPSGPTDRFIVLASRLIQQRRGAASRDRAGTMMIPNPQQSGQSSQQQHQARRVSMSAAQQPASASASVAAIAASSAASPSPPAPAVASFGLGFSNSSLLGLTVHCNGEPSSRSALTTSAPQLSHQSPPNVHSRTVSNQEPPQPSQPQPQQSQQQFSHPHLSHSSSTLSTPALSHGYSSHQNLKSLLSKQQHQQLANGPKLGGGSSGTSSNGSSGGSSGANSKQLAQQLGLAPQHSSHRPIPSHSSSSTELSHSAANSVQHTPVSSVRGSFLPQQQAQSGAAAAAKPASPAFVPYSAADLPGLLQALSSDDLLLLHRRYTEDVHASLWSSLVSARQRSRTALSALEVLVQEREEISRASADCVDLAYHYKQCLDATGDTLGQSVAVATRARSSASASAAATTSGAAASSAADDFDPAPTLALYHELFPHALQPHRNWSELLSSRQGSSSSSQPSAAPSASGGMGSPRRSGDVAAGVSLLSELIEWHRRLLDAARIIEAQMAAAAGTAGTGAGGAPGGPAVGGGGGKPATLIGQHPSAPFPIAVRPNVAELRKPDTSAVFVN